MPSLLAPISSTRNGASKSYTPLPDELNPPFKNTAPALTVTRNGTVTYGKRVASSSSSTSTNSDERGRNQDKLGAHLRSESEETLSPHKGKERAMNGYAHGEADLGEMRRADMKGKEKQWDPEQGMVQMDGAGGMDLDEGRYPPLNETQEEERRIQEVSECSTRGESELTSRNLLAESGTLCSAGYGTPKSRSSFPSTPHFSQAGISPILIDHIFIHAAAILSARLNLIRDVGWKAQ